MLHGYILHGYMLHDYMGACMHATCYIGTTLHGCMLHGYMGAGSMVTCYMGAWLHVMWVHATWLHGYMLHGYKLHGQMLHGCMLHMHRLDGVDVWARAREAVPGTGAHAERHERRALSLCGLCGPRASLTTPSSGSSSTRPPAPSERSALRASALWGSPWLAVVRCRV